MISMVDKRSDLETFLTDTLGAVKSGVKSEVRHRRETEFTADRRQRKKVMGDPIYYLEILFVGPFDSGVEVSAGKTIQGTHNFQVSFWYEYQDVDTYAGSSQETFDNLVHGTGTNNGIHVACLETTEVGSGSTRAILHNPVDENETVLPMDNGLNEVAHFFTFQIGVEG